MLFLLMSSQDMTKSGEESNTTAPTESRVNFSRRGYLKTAGSSAMLAGIAGCSGSNNQSSDTDSGENGSQTFKVGAIYPFSGAVAETGQNIREFIKVARDEAVNNKNDDLSPLVLSGEEGLSNHDATVEVIFADHRGDPAAGRSEAERLVQQEDVDMLIGGYHSSVTKTISQVAERQSVPHVNFESSSPSLTERDLTWFWRIGPHDETYTENMFQMFDDMNEEMDAGIETVGIIHEDSEFGSISAETQEAMADEFGYEIVFGPTAYTADSVSSLESQVQLIKQADPDVLLPSSYLKDAQILMQDLKKLNYFPNMVLGQDAGFNQPGFKQQTDLSNYVCSRSTYAPGLVESVPEIETYSSFVQEAVGLDFNGVYIRSWGGFISAMHAVNQAESLESEAIKESLNNLSIDNITSGLPYGVEFNNNNQNSLARGVLTQYDEGATELFWPFDLASTDVTYPAPSWDER